MNRRRLTLIWGSTVVALVASLALAAGAGAAIHSMRVSIYEAGYAGATRIVYMDLDGLNSALTTQVTVRRPGVVTPIEDEFEFSGNERYSTYDLDLLQPGDTVEIRQPNTAITPTVSYETPTAALNLTGTTASGQLGAGLTNTVSLAGTCVSDPHVTHLAAAGGPYSVNFGTDMAPGSGLSLESFNSQGFEFTLGARVPGERPCVRTRSTPTNYSVANPGRKDATPYSIYLNDLSPLIPTTRVVLRRAGTILEDHSSTTSSYLGVAIATAPQPGDTVELYRPQTAGSPSQVLTVPQLSGVFDVASDQAAVTGPVGRALSVYACQPLYCAGSSRSTQDPAPGRSFFDFTKSQSYNLPFDLQPDTRVVGIFQSATERIEHTFALSPGDLVAPTQSFKLPGKLKRRTLVKAFKRGFKIKLTSSELAVAKLSLTLPAASKSAKAKAKAKSKAVTLATAKQTLRAGTTTVTLKFRKSGKKALKKLAKGSSRSAVLTSTVTDPSGNASTVVKRTKIKA